MNWLKKTYYNLIRGISNLISYFRLIWKDRDWDYGFMLELERKKLQRAIKWYEKNDYGVAVNGNPYTVLACSNRKYGCDYQETVFVNLNARRQQPRRKIGF